MLTKNAKLQFNFLPIDEKLQSVLCPPLVQCTFPINVKKAVHHCWLITHAAGANSANNANNANSANSTNGMPVQLMSRRLCIILLVKLCLPVQIVQIIQKLQIMQIVQVMQIV